MMTGNKSSLWIALTAASLTLAACGDDETNTSATAGSSGGSTTATTTAATTTTTAGTTTMGSGSTSMGTTSMGTTTDDTGSTTDDTDSTSGGTTGGMMALPCPENDIGNMVPQVVMGTNMFEDDEFFSPGCSSMAAGAADVSHIFTAPADGNYFFDTEGSDYDTVLAVLDGATCGDMELVCNDDIDTQGGNVQSRVGVALTMGQQVLIVVDGFDGQPGSVGNYVLNVTQINGMGDCCMDNGSPGCDDPMIQACVCNSLPNCCLGNWDATCAAAVEGLSCGLCVGAPCPEQDIGMVVPQTINGNTNNESSEFDPVTPGCTFGPGNARDVGHVFTAPADGMYIFDTNGTAHDTVLYVQQGAVCGGTELACDDDGGAGFQSELTLNMTMGEQVVVMVDGYDDLDNGPYTLNVNQFVCPTPTVLSGMLPITFNGSNVGGGDVLDGSCDSSSSEEATHTFTAPADGLFSFTITAADFNTVLYATDGAMCGGAEIDCSDSFAGTDIVQFQMTMGQTVTIVVDGDNAETGNYTLVVDQIACPDQTLPMMVPQTVNGNNMGFGDAIEGSCDFTSGGEDVNHVFTATVDAVYRFDTVGTAFEEVLYVSDGAVCGGAELGCEDNTGNETLDVFLTNGQSVVVTVDGNATADAGAYTLNIDQVTLVCPTMDADIGMTVPFTQNGDTTAAGNDVVPTMCATSSTSPEVVLRWTAPAAGSFTFDTFGTAHDTVLYAIEGTFCFEMACNDDAAGVGPSEITVDLAMGQDILLVVDGFGSTNEGPYTLNITQN